MIPVLFLTYFFYSVECNLHLIINSYMYDNWIMIIYPPKKELLKENLFFSKRILRCTCIHEPQFYFRWTNEIEIEWKCDFWNSFTYLFCKYIPLYIPFRLNFPLYAWHRDKWSSSWLSCLLHCTYMYVSTNSSVN